MAPPCGGGAAKGELAMGADPGNEAPAGALPKAGVGAPPFTGGNAGSLAAPALPGSGAGNAPCAETCPAWNVTTATASGTINWRIIKAIPSGMQTSSRQESDSVWVFYDCCQWLTTRGIGQERGAQPRLTANNRAICHPLG